MFSHADVFAHNLRPGSAGQYGLDPETLRARKPELKLHATAVARCLKQALGVQE
uniref:CoA transferase n=1 Tax=Bordetella pertussis TaxID=520 RepID=UPI00366BAD1D